VTVSRLRGWSLLRALAAVLFSAMASCEITMRGPPPSDFAPLRPLPSGPRPAVGVVVEIPTVSGDWWATREAAVVERALQSSGLFERVTLNDRTAPLQVHVRPEQEDEKAALPLGPLFSILHSTLHLEFDLRDGGGGAPFVYEGALDWTTGFSWLFLVGNQGAPTAETWALHDLVRAALEQALAAGALPLEGAR